MGKAFLTQIEAYNKLGLSGGGGNQLITKQQLLNTNKVDTTYLNKYNPNDFVIDVTILFSALTRIATQRIFAP